MPNVHHRRLKALLDNIDKESISLGKIELIIYNIYYIDYLRNLTWSGLPNTITWEQRSIIWKLLLQLIPPYRNDECKYIILLYYIYYIYYIYILYSTDINIKENYL